jgi:D-alanine-D-alanine ligase
VAGREFTVLVVGDPAGSGRGTALAPIEYRFPAGREYKSYALKTSELHADANVRVDDPELRAALMAAAEAVFRGFDGTGYARMDFRLDATGRLFFLEVNFSCSVFYPEEWQGSADHILALDGLGQAGFLMRIIAEGRARHARKQQRYALRGDSIAGYGIVARRDLTAGEVVFAGEGRPQRIVTRRHVEATWSAEDRAVFDRYAYPLSEEVFVLWDRDPSEWAPQNHSCDPNTRFDGLDVVAVRAITAGEELTLDYAQFLDASAEAFECRCGASACRGRVAGVAGNSVTVRERAVRASL